jgi:mannan endo-1,4-beta-mannosidase
LPNGWTGPAVSRRGVLASIPLGVLVVSGLTACDHPAPRVFGLGVSGLDSSTVDQGEATAKTLGRRLDVLNVYEAFAWQQPLPTTLLNTIAAAGSVPEITWEPWDPNAGPTQPAYSLGQIAGGRYDAYITSWAKDAAAYQGRLLLRFAHEMNGNWYPWAVGAAGGSPEDYVAAYRRVRRLFDDAGATRVEWVWSPNVVINGDTDVIYRCYPGDEFVNIVGVDGYNFGDVAGHRWQPPADLFGGTLDLVQSIAPHKPVWINEVGCSDRGGDKAAWISQFVQYLTKRPVVGLLWFEVDKPGEADWRLTGTPQTTAAAKTALATW